MSIGARIVEKRKPINEGCIFFLKTLFMDGHQVNAMRVAKARVVTIEFTLKNDEGTVLESTLGGKPFEFLCGSGALLPALENALIGLRPGDEMTVVIPPSEGYGHKDKDLVMEVTKSSLPERDVTVGQRFRRLFHNGKSDNFRVTGFLDNWVFLNGNHPLAGVELHYEVNILDVRPQVGESWVWSSDIHGRPERKIE